jgi:peptide/nickel transport system substrate-binding protein
MEWDVPYEPSLLSDPAHFTPPYLALYPLVGVPWMDWRNSGGSEGEEPPQWVKDLWKIADEWPTLVPGTPRYMDLGKKMIRINMENLSIIGTLGQIPLMNVVSNRLGNVPEWTVNAYLYGYSYAYRCDQWYFK